jgi:hypothetical protein
MPKPASLPEQMYAPAPQPPGGVPTPQAPPAAPVGPPRVGIAPEHLAPSAAAGGAAEAEGVKIPEALAEVVSHAGDKVGDKFVSWAEEEEKRRTIEEEKRRLQGVVAENQRRFAEAGESFRRAMEGQGDPEAAQREWRKVGDDLLKAQTDLKEFLESYAKELSASARPNESKTTPRSQR